jgi:AcrR family transcriptional regulator
VRYRSVTGYAALVKCMDPPGERLSLRERKKRMTRCAILETARTMFAERGYDNVTVAEIADAVNVSSKTVFVHFPSKEDLVFDREAEMREGIVAKVRDRAAGETPLDGMAEFLRELDQESGSRMVAELDQLYRMIGDNLTLQSRLRRMWEQCEQELAEQLAKESGADPGAPWPRVVAAQLVMILRLMASEHLLGYLRAQPGPQQRAAIADWQAVALEAVGNGIAGYGPRAGPA